MFCDFVPGFLPAPSSVMLVLILYILLSLSTTSVLALPAEPDVIVDLGYSSYQGTSLDNGVSRWLGMRYAAPPVGDLRFRAPRDPLKTTTLQMANSVILCATLLFFFWEANKDAST